MPLPTQRDNHRYVVCRFRPLRGGERLVTAISSSGVVAQ